MYLLNNSYQFHLPSLVDYPDLEGDEARRSIWLVDVPLAATHHLRNSINTGKAIPREILERYEIPIVASALKLYLLELPGTALQNKPVNVSEESNRLSRFSRFFSSLRNHQDHLRHS